MGLWPKKQSGFSWGTLSTATHSYQVVKGKACVTQRGDSSHVEGRGKIIFSPSRLRKRCPDVLCPGVLVKGFCGDELSPLKSKRSKIESSVRDSSLWCVRTVPKEICETGIQVQQCFELGYKIANVKL